MHNQGKKRPLGWALIGCGGIGKAHAGWAAETPSVRVIGFCDLAAEAAQQLQQQYGGYATTDAGRIFADPTVEIVSIATTHDSHTELALAACRAGKHLFLEKPMAMTSADCLRIHEAVQAAGIKLMLNFSIRFSGAAQEIRRRLGPARVSHGQCIQPPADLSTWRWHPHLGGGPLFDVGVHLLDMLCWLHGAPPVELYATGGQVTHPGALGSPQMVDTVAATLRFADEGVATFLMSDLGSNPVISKWFCEFFDGRQTAVFYEHFTKVTFSSQDPATGQWQSETVTPPPLPRLPYLVDAIRRNSETFVPAQAGILATLLVEKLIASIQSGRPQPVELPEAIDSYVS